LGHGCDVVAGRRHRPVCVSAGLQNISAPAPVRCRCVIAALPVADSVRNTPPADKWRSPGSIIHPAADCAGGALPAESAAAVAASHRHFAGRVAGLPAITSAPDGSGSPDPASTEYGARVPDAARYNNGALWRDVPGQ